MAALGWLMNLDFAGGGSLRGVELVLVAAAVGARGPEAVSTGRLSPRAVGVQERTPEGVQSQESRVRAVTAGDHDPEAVQISAR